MVGDVSTASDEETTSICSDEEMAASGCFVLVPFLFNEPFEGAFFFTASCFLDFGELLLVFLASILSPS